MAGDFLGNMQQLHYYGRRRRRGIRARRGELGIPAPYVEGSTGRLHITAALTCDEDFVLLNNVIDVIGQHFLIDHRGRVSRTEAMVVTGDPREAELYAQVEHLAGETGAKDGWLITYTKRARRR